MKKESIKISQAKNDETEVHIHLPDDLSLENAQALKEKMESLIDKYSHFVFKVENANNVELVFLQLLYSIYRTCEEKKKEVEYHIDLNKDALTLLTNSGFENTLLFSKTKHKL